MFRFRLKSLNWKYIIGEVILIFLGINLAIWFNNWNTAQKLDANKQIAIAKVEGEIKNNLQELIRAREKNKNIPASIENFRNLRSDDHKGTVATVDQMTAYRLTYPDFFSVVDSVDLGSGLYEYVGNTSINIELAELTEIAWETTKDMGIANEFGFDCLYELENMYNIQRLVQQEINKSAEALQNNDVDRLVRVLDFIRQLDIQLERDYNRMLENISICR